MTINVLDEERHRQAAARYRSFSAVPAPGGKQLLRRELLRYLAKSACEREREAAKWLRRMIDHDATIDEIAKLKGSTKAAVRNLLKLAKEAMRQIAQDRSNSAEEDSCQVSA